MKPRAIIRDVNENYRQTVQTAADAIVIAIKDVQESGGGVVWIHREGCAGEEADETCPCYPVAVSVESKEFLN